jgi:5-methylcytosine-specific restriction endonuclease McrA
MAFKTPQLAREYYQKIKLIDPNRLAKYREVYRKNEKDRYANDIEYREKVKQTHRITASKYYHNTMGIGRKSKRFHLLEKYNYTCQYCGRKAPDVILEIDHIHPKSKGGKDVLENLTVACKDCNIGKHDKPLLL